MAYNSLRARLAVLLAMGLIQTVHTLTLGDWPNNPLGAFIYHGSAALCDLWMIWIAAAYLRGSTEIQIECLSLASIIVNAVAFFLYMRHYPAQLCNTAMLGVSLVYIARLLWIDRIHDAHDSERPVVRNLGAVRRQLHFGAKAT